MAVRDMSRFGTKHECYSCGKKFYDLNRERAICPVCSSDQAAAPKKKAPISSATAKLEVVEAEVESKKKASEEVAEFDSGELVEEELDIEGIDTDDEGLDDDEEDVAEAV